MMKMEMKDEKQINIYANSRIDDVDFEIHAHISAATTFDLSLRVHI